MSLYPGYEPLHAVLMLALDQAARGKGKERHANSRPFKEQPIFAIASRFGIGFLLGQADKKLIEAAGMLSRDEIERAKAEFLGAIVYISAAYLYLEKEKPEPSPYQTTLQFVDEDTFE